MANPTCRCRLDFVTFIIDATNDHGLATNFLQLNSAKDIYDFFQQKGYKDIPLNDCKDILDASKKMHDRGVDNNGLPVLVSGGPGY